MRTDFVDCYVLHCRHDGHECRHAFDSIQATITNASQGLANEALQSVSHISFNGSIVMSEQTLMRHIEIGRSVGLN